MQDMIFSRLWVANHDRFSDDVTRGLGQVRRRAESVSGDPMPLVARAMALVLAVSLTSLSIGATIA